MGFLLKIIFIYFLIKFIWSLFRVSIVKKLNNKIIKEMKKSMNHHNTNYENLYKYQEDTEDNSEAQNKSKTFDADYRVIKK